MTTDLIVPAFIAGLFTFLAPCTLPLVPGFLGFISGATAEDLKDPARAGKIKLKIFLNGVFYVIGFSIVFILLGVAIGLLGTALSAYRAWMTRVGGIFVILFGVFMIQSALVFYESRWPWVRYFKIPGFAWMTGEHRLPITKHLKPGNPLSSVLFGAAFALGWTPCVGPVLGAILTLAATEASVAAGAGLLAVFAAGLAVPFLIVAAGFGYFSERMHAITRVLPVISAVGGALIIFLGVLVLTNRLGIWIAYFFQWFSFLNYEQHLLDFL